MPPNAKGPAPRGPGGGLVCPSCSGSEFSERSSFKTTTEPLMGAESAGVTVDLMSCKRCGADLPAVRGRKRYSLVGQEKLAAMVADLEEAKRVNSEMESLADTMAKRSQGVIVETEKARVKGELSVIQSRVSALETETQGLEARRDRLAKTVATIASRVAA
ncbi:MAG: hypothetical protein JRM86_03075 [Nitrososphaerota archaeon]|nr:hypothetical protein [Nitrososphaerota archaeon]